MYYHVSLHNDPFEIGASKFFHPRLPTNGYLDGNGCVVEDTVTPRVCLAPTIFGCLVASHYDDDIVNFNIDYIMDLTIYATQDIPNIFIPRRVIKSVPAHYKGIVPDCHVTREVWSLDPIQLTVIEKFNWNKMDAEDSEEHKYLLLSMWVDEYNRQMPKKCRIKV